ncbi:MAG: type II toxin-antitoxin system VapC family toxin [Endomicrobium sp.]|jgi:tRNA(fMet)-specific endonuclease VapC|nr:type II toxin-antitoxin system VapC family toxin [Endomicrobium sp.]
MLFLDTDIVSYYFAGDAIVRDKLLDNIKDNQKICLTALNVYEVVKGLRYSGNQKQEKTFFDFLSNVEVFYLDKTAILQAADIYADLRKNGKPIGDADILIASIVMSHDGLLVSNNIKHYQNIKNLNLTNWI